VIAAIEAQLRRLPYAVTSFFTTEPAEQLAKLLASDAPLGLDKVWFALDGSEAVESALKLARQWAIETGQPQRREIISRRQSFHGNTLRALRRRQRVPPCTLRAAACADAPRLALLRLSRAGPR
jgi:adenosylmethionine-8-amino-7-oxononanoate aminotransferase